MDARIPAVFFPAGVLPNPEKGGAQTDAVNAGFAELLRGVHGRGAPRRFAAPVHEHLPRRDDPVFTEQDLDTFLRSLDPTLYPALLADDGRTRQVWRQFWTVRTAAAAYCLQRYIQEVQAQEGRRLDPTTDGEVLAILERRIARALFAADRAYLRRFVGRRGIDHQLLAFALWTSHANGWFALIEAPSLTSALASLLSGAGAGDAVDHGPRHPELEHRTAPVVNRTPSSHGVRLYQALAREPAAPRTRRRGGREVS
ncbi:MAG: hypothetical protein IT384_30560 [Deltaproteobacteria bacterium]|nr:hypothetical protein [Deltaproteobacteria bacterium]